MGNVEIMGSGLSGPARFKVRMVWPAPYGRGYERGVVLDRYLRLSAQPAGVEPLARAYVKNPTKAVGGAQDC